MGFISADKADMRFPGAHKIPWGKPVECFAINHPAIDYSVTGKRMAATKVLVVGSCAYRARALDGSIITRTFSVLSAALEYPLNPDDHVGVSEVYDYRRMGAEELPPETLESLFEKAEGEAVRLKKTLERIHQLAGLSAAKGEEPLLTDLLTATPAAGVQESQMHLAEMAAARDYTFDLLASLLPQNEVARLRNVTRPVRPGAAYVRTPDPKIIVFKPPS